MGKSFKDNLLTADKMRDEILRLQKAGKKVVFTNGVFDILHVGHLTYLEEAKNLGDILVVGVNSDASVKVNKGDKRPINSETNRAFVLLGTKFVDYTVIFNEKTPEKLLDILKPDIHVKGGDYKKEDLPETKIVELVKKAGGTIVKEPQDVFWGGYHAYFCDLDGYYWEVALESDFKFDENGLLQF